LVGKGFASPLNLFLASSRQVEDEHRDEPGEDDSFPLLKRILFRTGTRCRSVARG
jgi:hypothetical protein